MEETAELIKAIATLLWPILGFIVLIIFRVQIAKAISRIKKGKFFGQEVEHSEDLEKLQKSATEASNEVASIPTFPIDSTKDEEDTKSKTKEEDLTKNIIYEASRSPKVSLILLAFEVEKEARQTLASIGKLKGKHRFSLMQTVNKLDSLYGFPKHVASSLRHFWDTLNKIIHGGEDQLQI